MDEVHLWPMRITKSTCGFIRITKSTCGCIRTTKFTYGHIGITKSTYGHISIGFTLMLGLLIQLLMCLSESFRKWSANLIWSTSNHSTWWSLFAKEGRACRIMSLYSYLAANLKQQIQVFSFGTTKKGQMSFI